MVAKPVYVADIIRGVRLDFAPLGEKKDVRLDGEVPHWAKRLFAPKNLRSVVYNLLRNAGGTIVVQRERGAGSPFTVHFQPGASPRPKLI